MAHERFTWDVDAGADGEHGINSTELRFGDGFGTVVGNGLRASTQAWSVKLTGDYRQTDSQAHQARKFIMRHLRKPFLWTTPAGDDVVVRVVGSIRESAAEASLFTLSMTFKEFPEP